MRIRSSVTLSQNDIKKILCKALEITDIELYTTCDPQWGDTSINAEFTCSGDTIDIIKSVLEE